MRSIVLHTALDALRSARSGTGDSRALARAIRMTMAEVDRDPMLQVPGPVLEQADVAVTCAAEREQYTPFPSEYERREEERMLQDALDELLAALADRDDDVQAAYSKLAA